MNSLTNFNFHEPVSGQFFLSRQSDVTAVSDHLGHKRNVVIYAGYKTGKQSLVSQAFEKLSNGKSEIIIISVDLHNIRCVEEFLSVYIVELTALSRKLDENALFPLAVEDLQAMSMEEILCFPDKMGAAYGKNLIVYLKNFHNVLNFDKSEEFLKNFEGAVAKRSKVTYMITGACVNMMQEIFEKKKYFYGLFENMKMSPLKKNEVADFIEWACVRTGRVIERDISESMYEICDGHPWYVMQLASFCYNLTLGYVNSGIVDEGKKMLMALHSPRFMNMIDGLTESQINFLKAVIDGVERYTSAEVMAKYHLNSSANVARVKEAMRKKEILVFDGNDKATVIDPMFEYWLKNYYFL